MDNLFNIGNIILGGISVLAIISGFLIKPYQIIFWVGGLALLIVVGFSSYVFDNRNRIFYLETKFKKIEETLNIYNRLNKLELKMDKMSKKGQINIIDIIKIGLALILIYAFIKALTSM